MIELILRKIASVALYAVGLAMGYIVVMLGPILVTILIFGSELTRLQIIDMSYLLLVAFVGTNIGLKWSAQLKLAIDSLRDTNN